MQLACVPGCKIRQRHIGLDRCDWHMIPDPQVGNIGRRLLVAIGDKSPMSKLSV